MKTNKSSTASSQQERTIQTVFLRSTTELKTVIACYASTATLNLKRVAQALGTSAVEIVSLQDLRKLYRMTPKGIAIVAALRQLPILIDTALVSKRAILIDSIKGKNMVELDPLMFVRLVNGQLYNITDPRPPTNLFHCRGFAY
jgi:prolyl-tRNA editing enzyme YbaK/EbsC (Cys-tRNA(Pro) deacylase)